MTAGALAARVDSAPQVDERAVERAARALWVAEQDDDESRAAAGRYWDNASLSDAVIPRKHYRSQAQAALSAARGDAAPAVPLRTEWGVLLDDLGSTDVHASRDQAEAARHLADGDLPLVRIETWVVRDERPSSTALSRSCSCSQPMELGRHGHACDLYDEGPQGGDRS